MQTQTPIWTEKAVEAKARIDVAQLAISEAVETLSSSVRDWGDTGDLLRIAVALEEVADTAIRATAGRRGTGEDGE